jgi:hypothetical protein
LTSLAARTYIALLHHPVYDRTGSVVATAITNLDIHDLARSTRTFGVAAYYLVTPLERQRELAHRIVGHWDGEDGPRAEALKKVRVAPTLADVVTAITNERGAPRVVATAARVRDGKKTIDYAGLREMAGAEQERPLLVLFGTGWGLAESVIEESDQVLSPIAGADGYNHLSVRSAAAIILDRLFGERQQAR